MKPASKNLSNLNYMKPVSQVAKRGRPKGSGAQLTPSQRATNSRTSRLALGYKRVEVWLTPYEARRLEWAKSNGFAWFARTDEEWKIIISEYNNLNKQRRKELIAITTQIGAIKAELEACRDGKAIAASLHEILIQVEALRDDVESIHGDEESAYDNLPESMQDSERGYSMQEAGNQLREAVCSLEDAIEKISAAIDA